MKEERPYGMTAKGRAMPQTIDEWRHLAALGEEAMLRDKDTIARLKMKVNNLEQKIKGMRSDIRSACWMMQGLNEDELCRLIESLEVK